MNIAEKIYKKLFEDIVYARLMPGEHIKELSIAKEFQCSRGPVREALKRLEGNEFVTIEPNYGATVTKISPEDIKDLYTLLGVLEGKAVEWAVPFINSEDLAYIVDTNQSLKNLSIGEGNFFDDWFSLNRSFHRFFIDKCNNKKMNWLIEQIRTRIARYRYTSLVLTATYEYLQDHETIIKAVHQKDARKAGEAMTNHIYRGKKLLLDFFSHIEAQ